MNQIEKSEWSFENTKKLDQILTILKGNGEDMPGLINMVAQHNKILFGKDGKDGIVHHVDNMRRFHTWFLCSLSAGFGFLLNGLIQYIAKHI